MSTKTCNNCSLDLPVSDFYSVNKRGKPTTYHICKLCCAAQKMDMKSYYRDWELKKKYGITLETYKEESEKRNNICDICTTKVETLHVDHCHSSMKVRGFLCGSCNRALGLFKDSQDVLENAIKYLKERN